MTKLDGMKCKHKETDDKVMSPSEPWFHRGVPGSESW